MTFPKSLGITEHPTLLEAQRAAGDAAVASGSRVFTCIVFRQGGRTMITTAFPYATLIKHVSAHSASKGESPRLATNRPIDSTHVRAIAKYLDENESYILPPITLNIRSLPALHVPEGNFSVRAGFMLIGDETKFSVTDGQHRVMAIGKHAETLPDGDQSFLADSASVVIVVEDDISRVHQDFADAARTKQIPASLLAVYNTREPLNRVLAQVVDGSKLLNGRVDETSSKLSKNSSSVFLLNNVRGLVKELLFHDYALSEASVPPRSAQVIETIEKQDAFVARTLTMLDTLTEHMAPWSTIVELPTSGGPANQVIDFRQQYVNMTATGLVVIGHVVFEIDKNPDAEWRAERYIDLATKIDWRRNAEIWSGNIITGDKIATTRGPGRAAADKVMAELGIRPAQPTIDG